MQKMTEISDNQTLIGLLKEEIKELLGNLMMKTEISISTILEKWIQACFEMIELFFTR